MTADLDPTEGDTVRVASQLIEELGDQEEIKNEEDIDIRIEKSYETNDYEAETNIN